jgi:hypothetical protein
MNEKMTLTERPGAETVMPLSSQVSWCPRWASRRDQAEECMSKEPSYPTSPVSTSTELPSPSY